jgi:surface polysaccharide O-acyltransferase-like enzyme
MKRQKGRCRQYRRTREQCYKTEIMKPFIFLSLIFMAVTLTGCELIGDIFSAGVYTGIFAVVVIVAIVIWILVKMGNRK